MEALYPTDIDEAVQAVADGMTPLAGGTDLMVEVNFRQSRPERVVSLRRVRELAELDGPRIGAGVTWRRIEREGPRALAQAARTVGSPQIRNAGTIGGNVGTASPAGDGLPFLAAVDARIELASPTGRRTVPWEEFFVGVKKTDRHPDELITAVVLPDRLPARHEFAKVGVRNAMVIATVCCVVTRADDGRVTVALGSVAPTPMRARQAETMISAEPYPSEAALAEFARLVSEEVTPITDHRSTEQYRRHAAGVLARRLLERCLREPEAA
ncbi:MAG TPA: FAD binding domain-containing protein [Acidimicrobiia bacterium]|nr:FAD binding domain-containing protein [Acidimicrobiia bacterium]